MTKNKKPIPNIADILEMFDIKSEEYAVRSPEQGKEKADSVCTGKAEWATGTFGQGRLVTATSTILISR